MRYQLERATELTGFCLLVIVFFVVWWVYTIVDILKNDFTVASNKIAWLLVVMLIAPLGLPLYALIGRSQKKLIGDDIHSWPSRRRNL